MVRMLFAGGIDAVEVCPLLFWGRLDRSHDDQCEQDLGYQAGQEQEPKDKNPESTAG